VNLRVLYLSIIFLICLFSFSYSAGKDTQWIDYGNSLIKKENYEKAIIAFINAIEINPDNYYAHVFAGDVYLMLHDPDSAIQYYYRAYDIKANPELRTRISEVESIVYGMNKLSCYPFSFQPYVAIGLDSSNSNFFRYGLLCEYYFMNWFSGESGIMYTGGIDIPLSARFSLTVPWNKYQKIGISVGGYYSVLSYPFAVEDNDIGSIIGVDANYMLGRFATASFIKAQFGLGQRERFCFTIGLGIKF